MSNSSAHEVVLSLYDYFAERDMEGFKSICHDDYKFINNGMHRFSGTLDGFDVLLTSLIMHIPRVLPNFKTEVISSFANETQVFVHCHLTADDLDSSTGHYFAVENRKIKEHHVFDDSQKLAHAMKAVV